MLLARSTAAAEDLRHFLAEAKASPGGSVYGWRIAGDGLRLRLPATAGRE
jgi:hypothetical protein